MRGPLSRLPARLAALQEAGLRRFLRRVEPTSATEARVDGRPAVLFCSNDYLGLAHHPAVVAAAQGAGAGASRLISGNRPVHEALEEALGAIYGGTATLFGSGYQANVSLFACLPEAEDHVASDAANHASIIDGLRLAKAGRTIVPHGTPEAIPAHTTLAVTESLFSMDGDLADLARWRGPWSLVVDEAHAVGALGPAGRGVGAAQGAPPDVLVGTLGKAYGAAGAFVVGPPELRELLLNAGRGLVYSTALPESVARAALEGLRRADDEARERLAANTRRLRTGLAQLGVPLLGDAHIVPLLTGPRTMAVAADLLDRGVLAPGVRWPTVPRGAERVRLTVSAAHSPAQIDRCVEAVAESLAAVPIVTTGP